MSDRAPHARTEPCNACRGRGRIGGRKRPVTANGVLPEPKTCEACGGRGYFVLRPCEGCLGSGRGPKIVDDPLAMGPECRQCKGLGHMRSRVPIQEERRRPTRRDLMLQLIDLYAVASPGGPGANEAALTQVRGRLEHLQDDLTYLAAYDDVLADPEELKKRKAHRAIVLETLRQAAELLVVAERVLTQVPAAYREATLAYLETKIPKG